MNKRETLLFLCGLDYISMGQCYCDSNAKASFKSWYYKSFFLPNFFSDKAAQRRKPVHEKLLTRYYLAFINHLHLTAFLYWFFNFAISANLFYSGCMK